MQSFLALYKYFYILKSFIVHNIVMDSLKIKFKKLSKVEKQKKLYMFISQLDNWDETIHHLKILLEKRTEISEQFLVDTYFGLLDFAQAVKNDEKKKALLHLKVTHEKIKKIAQTEEKEKKEADNLLSMIE